MLIYFCNLLNSNPDLDEASAKLAWQSTFDFYYRRIDPSPAITISLIYFVMKKKIFLGLLAIFVIIQFIRPEKNNSDDRTYDISTAYQVPQNVASVMKAACNDCHSNHTRYPWYSNIQPIGWWLNNHIEHGKGHLNFSAFTSKRVAVQNHKFEEIVEMVEEKKMPIPSYTNFGLHPEANLSDDQRQALIDWSEKQMEALAEKYPTDSLILRR